MEGNDEVNDTENFEYDELFINYNSDIKDAQDYMKNKNNTIRVSPAYAPREG